MKASENKLSDAVSSITDKYRVGLRSGISREEIMADLEKDFAEEAMLPKYGLYDMVGRYVGTVCFSKDGEYYIDFSKSN